MTQRSRRIRVSAVLAIAAAAGTGCGTAPRPSFTEPRSACTADPNTRAVVVPGPTPPHYDATVQLTLNLGPHRSEWAARMRLGLPDIEQALTGDGHPYRLLSCTGRTVNLVTDTPGWERLRELSPLYIDHATCTPHAAHGCGRQPGQDT